MCIVHTLPGEQKRSLTGKVSLHERYVQVTATLVKSMVKETKVAVVSIAEVSNV